MAGSVAVGGNNRDRDENPMVGLYLRKVARTNALQSICEKLTVVAGCMTVETMPG